MKTYDEAGYDSEGYSKKGYDKDGYDRNGNHRSNTKFDYWGYDKEGYDANGEPPTLSRRAHLMKELTEQLKSNKEQENENI